MNHFFLTGQVLIKLSMFGGTLGGALKRNDLRVDLIGLCRCESGILPEAMIIAYTL